MRRRWTQERAALFAAGTARAGVPRAASRAPTRRSGPHSASRGKRVLVGRDFSRGGVRPTASRSAWIAAALGLVLAALLLTALRLAILRTRYELGEATKQEEALLQRDRSATVELQRLRDPSRLRRLAQERGFVTPQHIVVLPARGNAP